MIHKTRALKTKEKENFTVPLIIRNCKAKPCENTGSNMIHYKIRKPIILKGAFGKSFGRLESRGLKKRKGKNS